VTSEDPAQHLPTSVQKSYFMLSRLARAVLDTALRKYRPGRSDLISVGGIAQLKPALRLMTAYRLMIQEVTGAEVLTSYTRWLECVQVKGGAEPEIYVAFSPRFVLPQRIPRVPPKKTLSQKPQSAESGSRAIGVSRLPVKVPSSPLPDFVEPMKAQLVASMPAGDWIYEIKFDGYRALALRGGRDTRILSRNQRDLGKKFPEITSSIAALDVQDAIIDGEIVALDDKGRPSFQLLQGFDMGMARPSIVFYAFDLLRLNGEDLRGLPIEERKAKLAALLKNPPPAIRYSASFTQNIDQLLKRVRELSLEGLIGKRVASKYDSKRSGAWIKIKLYQQGSFVIGGYTQPAGERKHMGALLVGVYEKGKLKFAGRVGTGFSERLLKALSLELDKIAVKACPFFNLPAIGRGLDPGLTVAETRRCVWVKPSM
jgi:DNA ligase D-like protein (predicted ligase)